MTCILSGLYGLATKKDSHLEDVFKLDRKTAEELVLCSVFSLIAASNLLEDFDQKLYATDASLNKGAACSREIDHRTAKELWLSGDKRGSYTKMDSHFREVVKAWDIQPDAEEEPHDIPCYATPKRQLPFVFDFVEVCGGAASVSKCMGSRGFSVMPPIELSDSPWFDLRSLRLVEWLADMLWQKRLRSAMFEPVCATFSAAAHPCLRSYAQPKGFQPSEPRTMLGNIIAFRCIFLAWISSLCGAPSLLEQPRVSKMAWLSAWRFLLRFKGFSEAIVASCQFGSIHRKEFRLLLHGIDPAWIERKCPGGHTHVPIAGSYTKPSAIYVPKLAEHFADAFEKALRRQKTISEQDDVKGIESVVANDLLLSGNWKTDLQWHWKSPNHINVLESYAYLALLKNHALRGGPGRFSALLDSQVAKGCHAKGRSSAKGLAPTLKKAAAVQLAYGQYPSLGYAPTKLNIADDPTRDVPLRPADHLSLTIGLKKGETKRLHVRGLPRVLASWSRLLILLVQIQGSDGCSLQHAFLPCRSLYLLWIFTAFATFSFLVVLLWISARLSSTALTLKPPWICHWICFCPSVRCLQCLILFGLFSHCQAYNFGVIRTEFHGMQPLPLALVIATADAMAFGPNSADERVRAQRRATTELQRDRVVKPQTRSRREVLLRDFESWLVENVQITLADLVDAPAVDPEHVSDTLAAYGRAMFYAGKSYGRFSETINAIAARRPYIKRSLVSAWDVAFSWITDEPHVHHPAMPLTVVLAFWWAILTMGVADGGSNHLDDLLWNTTHR